MASQLTIFPSLNRNLTHIFDQNESGLVAYGSRAGIYVFNFQLTPPTVLDNKVILNSHRGKILSISFCKVNNNELLASIGEDALLKIWDLETRNCIASLEVKELSKIVEWLYDSTDSVVFSDFNGYVTKWNFKTNKLIRMKGGSEVCVSSLASNPKDSKLLAAGHSSGAVSIFNVVNHIILYKLRTHSSEVTSLSWSPVLPDILLSTSLDLSARLWKMGECNPVKTYYYPTSRTKFEDKKYLKICGICHPEKSDTIICSNIRGDFGSVTFKENETPKFTSFSFTKDWENNFKSVVTMLPYYHEKDGVRRQLLLSCDYLKISVWDISEQKLVSSFPFLIGGIFDLSLSRLNPNLLSICTGDGTLKVWNLSCEEKLEMSTIYIHHRIKIMAAVWHPYEENLLAYGTDEGKVGVADFHRKKNMYSFETHHGGSIYSLQWGPCTKIGDMKEIFLYSCGGGVIYIHAPNKPKEKSHDFNTFVQLPADLENIPNQHSEICWKSDYSCFAVGSYKGFVDLFNSDLSFLTRFTVQMKNIESLRWHPLVTVASPDGSPYKAWLGAAGNDEKIHIIDTSVLSGESGSTLTKSAKVLVGHKKRVSSICWSQHVDGHLVSGSRDGTVQVWNVCTNTLIANYPWHRDMVHAVYWSASDPDVIYSGGTDNSLRIWKISLQTASGPPEKSMIVKFKTLKTNKAVKKPKEEISIEKKLSESQINTNEVGEISELVLGEEIPDTVETYSKKFSEISLKAPYSRKNANLFTNLYPKSLTKEEYLENIFKLVDHLYEHPSENSSGEKNEELGTTYTSKFGFFSDQKTALEMLATHAKLERDEGNKLRSFCLNLMSCNAKPLITEAAENKELTDFLVAAAPSVSLDFWRETCVKFAIQLVEEELYVKASIYYMFGEKLYDGIKLLMEKGKILEALAFAKARLPENDPYVRAALEKASKYFSLAHQIECEAACRLALKDPLQAARLLYCVADSKYIYAATYICNKFKLKEQAEAYAYFCMEKCLVQNDWQTFYKVIDQVESLKVYTALIKVHEIISNHLKPLKKEDGLVAVDIFGVTGSKVQIWSGKFSEGTEQSLLAHALKVLLSEGIIQPQDKESLERIREALNSLEMKRKRFETSAEAHICIAIYATQAIISSVLDDFDLVKKCLNKIFSTSYNVVFLPKVVCWLFLPLSIYCCKDTEVFDCDTKYQDQESCFGRCFQTFYKSLSNKLCKLDTLKAGDPADYQDILPHLKAIVQKLVALLQSKDVDDSILLYFFASYLNEMRRMTKKGWKFRCYENASSNDIEAQVSSINESKSTVLNFENKSVDKQIEVGDEVIKNTCVNIQADLESFAVDADKAAELRNCSASDAESQAKLEASHVHEDKLDMASKESGKNEQLISETSCETINQNKFGEEKASCNFELSDELKELIQTVLKEAEEKTQQILESQSENKEQSKSGEIPVLQNDAISENIDSQNVACDDRNSEGNRITLEGKDVMSLVDDQHIQCWNDLNMCYILTKTLFSVLCRNEFAVLYFLEKHLQEASSTGATSGVKHNSLLSENVNNTEILIDMSKGAKDTCIDLDQTKPEGGANSETLLRTSCVDIPNIDSNLLDVSMEVSANSNSLTTNKSHLSDTKDGGGDIANCSENKLNVDNGLQNGVTLETEGVKRENDLSSSCSNSAIETVGVSHEDLKNPESICENNSVQNGVLETGGIKNDNFPSSSCNGSVDETVSISHEDLKNSESICKNTPSVENEKLVSSNNLHHERKNISEQYHLLKSVDFQYPNPFDAASNITAVCCDIFHKNPCKSVQDKFHDIAHQVIEWRQNFSIGDVPIVCEICQKTTHD